MNVVTVKTAPTKVSYNVGDNLDLTGLVVTLQKSNGSTEDVGLADFASKGITVSPTNGTALTVLDNTVTITVSGKTVTQMITVTPITVTNVAVKTAPTKVSYNVGDNLDLTGLVVTLQKSNGSTEDVGLADFASKGITVSPEAGAVLTTSTTAVTITVSGKTVTQAITVTPITVTNVTVKTVPTKVTYNVGETLDLAGLVVTLQKSNGTSEEVAFADFVSKGITVSPTNGTALTASNNTVTITVSGKTVTQMITVTPITVTNVAVKTAPTKVSYNVGDNLDLTGLVVTLQKSNGSTEDVGLADFASKGITVSPTNGTALTALDNTVTITVSGKTVTQAITVTPITVTNVTVKTAPTKVSYNVGDNLDLTGLVVTLQKSNGSTEDVGFADFASKGITVNPTNGTALTTSNNTVTITVSGKTITQMITVTPITVTNVAVKTAPTKVSYNVGDNLDLTGLVVTLQKSNGSTEDVGFADFASKGITVSPTNGTALTMSNNTVTITVSGKTVTQAITVTP
ncbi:bacterial Ig-like domain-containing protein [Lysinibacillus sp. NPDC047702]|uniref:bacterial Ig-like domain-containing protein n=1 Tax=unclassified Lysinibacillus TaxID=2636778 RepID=UPI003D002F4F